MPLGIVSDSELLGELHNSGSSVQESVGGIVINETNNPGRSPGDNNVPESLRKIIGEESIVNGRKDALALAKMFGISDSSVSAYAKGATSTDSYHKPNGKLQSYLQMRKERITKKALRTLTSALDEITPEKLKEIKVKDAASIAKDMAAVVKSMEDTKQSVNGDQQNNQFIFYAPQFMPEDRYDVVQVNE